MLRRQAWCCATAVLLATGVGGFARDDDSGTYNSVKDLEAKRKQRLMATQTIWWEHFIPGRMEEKKKIAEGKNETAAKPDKEKEQAKPRPAETATLMQQEMQKYLRREDVCRRLREVAEETKDPDLIRQADLLESRAWAAYEQSVASARLPKVGPLGEQDVQTKLMADSKKPAAGSARAEAADPIRSIRGEGKE
jgi:hypothetical protein